MNHDFYLMTEPGLEDEALLELNQCLPLCLDRSQRPQLRDGIKIESIFSGILLQAPLETGLQLNLWMKTITRILLRIDHFRCLEFYQLEKELKKIDLKPWIKEKSKIHFRISSAQSKLGQEKRIASVCEKIFSNFYQITQDQGQRIYLRAQNDEFTVSIDTSGDALYQRGYLKLRGPAPLRENKAALMLKWMTADLSLYEKNEITWLDPMAGSGTLISESLHLYEKSLHRDFAFEKFQNLHFVLKDRSAKAFQSLPFQVGKKWVAADIQNEAVSWMVENLKQNEKVKVVSKDFLASKNRSEYEIDDNDKLYMIINPPYGERIELKSKTEQEVRLEDVFLQCEKLQPERFGILVPEKFRPVAMSNYSMTSWKFKNGGLPVHFLVYRRK